ncbi:MAG TPA: hypothetical protein VMH81_30430 [Bryobacteraceae bacterium]|nr:hypothetical protein [Bryobacteraceae bacterium]
MTSCRAVPFLIFLISVLGGCSKESAPSAQTPSAAPSTAPTPVAAAPPPAAAPAASAALKTEDTNIDGVTAEVTECTRKDGVLSVKVRFRNTSGGAKKVDFFAGHDYEKYYVSAASKKYFILKDTEGAYLTPAASSFGGLSVNLQAGGQYTWWAKYPAPPADIKAVTLYTQVAAPLEDIPVSDK